MMGNITRNPIALAILAIGLLILIGSTFSIVPETRQAVIALRRMRISAIPAQG